MNKPKIVLMATLSLFALTACDGKNVPGSTDNPSATDNAAGFFKEAPKCNDCGTIISITPVAVKGDSTGAGGAIGAVVGGLLGHQVGGGKGKDVATVVGVVGGAVAGNEIEKQKNAASYFDFVVGLEAGGERTIRLASTQGLSVGSAVKIVGSSLQLR